MAYQQQEKVNHGTKTTAKGTILELSDVKGKPYLPVALRLVWFREDHPLWTIETIIHEWNAEKKWVVFRAQILDETGRVIAQATKSETSAGFADYLEKAETGAIGRALAMCGYGTQFEPELDEGERLADAPVTPAKVSVATPPPVDISDIEFGN